MKRRIARLVSLCIVLSSLAGCGNWSPSGGEPENPNRVIIQEDITVPEDNTEPQIPTTEPREHDVGTVTAGVLNVRTGPGTNYQTVRELKKGDVVRVYSFQMVDGIAWGEVDDGWICLIYVSWQDETTDVADASLASKLVGSWYVEIATPENTPPVFCNYIFESNGEFVRNIYYFDDDYIGFHEDNDSWTRGKYNVVDGWLILEFTYIIGGTREQIPVAGREYTMGDRARVRASVSGNRLVISDKENLTLEKGGLEEFKKIALERKPEPPSIPNVIDERILGEWYAVGVVEDEEKALAVSEHYIFYADGTYEGDVRDYKRYLYSPETGLEYDRTQPGSGSVRVGGTYSYDGTTLYLNMTFCEFDAEELGIRTFTAPMTGDTISWGDYTFYHLTWEEIGPYFFES